MRWLALSVAGVALFAAALANAGEAAASVLGKRPAYSERALSKVPNAEAMSNLIWSPGLDEGYVPQGLTVLGDAIFVGTYRSEDANQSRGPCRIYRLDPGSGKIAGMLDLPSQCGHAGGLARGRKGHIWVADTRNIFEIELAPSGSGALGRVVGSIRLTGNLRGSFAAGASDALWLGSYTKEPGARLYRLPFTKLSPETGSLSEQDAEESVTVPTKVQGAAFDATGRLWITRSGSTFGELLQLDGRTGAILRRFDMPAGIEDISFAPDGGLWAVGEAGSKRWLGWRTFFPVVLRLQPDLLR